MLQGCSHVTFDQRVGPIRTLKEGWGGWGRMGEDRGGRERQINAAEAALVYDHVYDAVKTVAAASEAETRESLSESWQS